MKAPNGNPLTPDSLAADGMQGADAKALGQCMAEHSPVVGTARWAVLFAIDAARERLERYALTTDEPLPGMVEAADLLDAAAQCLTSTEVSEGIASVREVRG